MFKCLSPGTIGIRGATLSDTIELARKTGFGGVALDIREANALVKAHSLGYVSELFESAGVLPGTWGMPVVWNQGREEWERDLSELPELAALAYDLGCTRTATWCPPASDERNFDENYAWHVERFRPIAEVLRDHGCRFGIEFIGPKTSRTGMKYPFIHTLTGMMNLAEDIGTGNVGLLLDAWHLYTSGGDVADLDTITEEDVVLLHVNDAPAGVAADDQIDTIRRLPMEPGVIDLPALMRKLKEMGYTGPVVPEPFSQRVNEIAATDPLAAATLAAGTMNQLWEESGLG